MRQLVIGYVLEGARRGYNFTSPTLGVDDHTLTLIWRSAMPRGQGWGAAVYNGAAALKCFPVKAGQIALSTVTVTDQSDENGRRGIRRAVIDILSPSDCLDRLVAQLASYPDGIRAQSEKHTGFWQRHQIMERAKPEKNSQAILLRTFSDSQDWQVVEATILRLVTGRKNPRELLPFTTLALDYRDETALVGIPAQQISQIGDAPYFRIT